MDIGNIIKKYRREKDLTQEQLAEFLELQSYQTINRIENGKSFTTVSLLEKMCKFFDVSPAYFFSESFYFSDKEQINYMQQIKHLLPLLSNTACPLFVQGSQINGFINCHAASILTPS